MMSNPITAEQRDNIAQAAQRKKDYLGGRRYVDLKGRERQRYKELCAAYRRACLEIGKSDGAA